MVTIKCVWKNLEKSPIEEYAIEVDGGESRSPSPALSNQPKPASDAIKEFATTTSKSSFLGFGDRLRPKPGSIQLSDVSCKEDLGRYGSGSRAWRFLKRVVSNVHIDVVVTCHHWIVK